MKGDLRLFPLFSFSISLSLSRMYVQSKGYLHLYLHLCSSLKSREQTASYVCTRVNIRMLQLLQAFQTGKQNMLLLDAHTPCGHQYFF